LKILQKKICARIIQNKWRNIYNKKNEAVCIIQKNWRCYDIRKKYKIKKDKAIMIQRRYRIFLENKRKKDKKIKEQKMINSAIKIQKNWKNHILKRNLKLLNKQINAYKIICHSWINYQKKKYMYKRSNESALIIQNAWKEYKKRKGFY